MIINNKSSNENINLNGTELKNVRYFKYLRINIDDKIGNSICFKAADNLDLFPWIIFHFIKVVSCFPVTTHS